MSFQNNVVKSFRKVRDEIENLQHQILELKEKVEDLDKILLKKEKGSTVKKVKFVKRRVRKRE